MNESQMRMIVKAAIEAIPVNYKKMKEIWVRIQQELKKETNS